MKIAELFFEVSDEVKSITAKFSCNDTEYNEFIAVYNYIDQISNGFTVDINLVMDGKSAEKIYSLIRECKFIFNDSSILSEYMRTESMRLIEYISGQST